MSSTTWHAKVASPIPADVDPTAVTKVIQDHDYILSLNPMVISHQKVREEGHREIYSITDSIPIIPPIWKRTVTFEAIFEDKDDGMETWVAAPMGVNMHAKYVVKWVEEGLEGLEGAGWVLEEAIECSCSFLLKAFVERTTVSSHRQNHKQFIEKARERQGREDGAGRDAGARVEA